MKDHKKKNREGHTIIPTAPGSNPSSFPRYEVPVDPTSGLDIERGRGDCIELPDGGHIAPNGAVIPTPNADDPEVRPDYEFTPEKEDLDLLEM